jgi:hypothetical protein
VGECEASPSQALPERQCRNHGEEQTKDQQKGDGMIIEAVHVVSFHRPTCANGSRIRLSIDRHERREEGYAEHGMADPRSPQEQATKTLSCRSPYDDHNDQFHTITGFDSIKNP